MFVFFQRFSLPTNDKNYKHEFIFISSFTTDIKKRLYGTAKRNVDFYSLKI